MVEKITFNDLKKEQPLKIKVIKINDKEIEIKQYLPVNDKLELITNVLKQIAGNEYAFANPVQLYVYQALEFIYHYASGIEFSEEEKADPAKLFDELEEQGIIDVIIKAIPQDEYQFVYNGIYDTINAYYAYRNSVKGIIEDVTTDYSNLDLDATEIQKKLADPNNMTLLKDVVKKLG